MVTGRSTRREFLARTAGAAGAMLAPTWLAAPPHGGEPERRPNILWLSKGAWDINGKSAHWRKRPRSEALVDWGETEKGLARLAEALEAPLEKTRLLAAGSLSHLGQKARPILPRMKSALQGMPRYPKAVLERVVGRLA